MLKGKKVILRPIDIEKDIERLTVWFNDPEICYFIGKNYRPLTKEKERDALKKILADDDIDIFAIDTHNGKHIGVTSLGSISTFNGTASTGTVVGDKESWSKGYGTDAKMLLLHHAFFHWGLRRINSRVFAFNKRSLGCQLKCGYIIEGVMKKEVLKQRKFHDIVCLAVFYKDWIKLWREYKK